MKSCFATLFAPADTVVAVHESVADVETAVKLLGQAGYPGRMLGVVARQCPLRAVINETDRGWLRRWSATGAFWGAAWIVIAVADSMLLARNVLPFGMILMSGALMLAMQTALVCWSVAPERSTKASWHASSQPAHPYRQELAANRLLLVVKGSRSEVALARSLLAMHAARAGTVVPA
jgi:hypothetical protein